MKLSIILSTYNGEKYIAEQLDSFKSQILQPDEVLIFDDCSSDNTVSIINAYIRENRLSNWKLICNKDNKGWKRNFVEGFFMAAGDLIFPSDQDDIWLPEKLQECEVIMQNNPKINVLASNYTAFYDNGHMTIGPETETGELFKYQLDYTLLNTMYPGCTYCFRRSMLPLLQKYWMPEFAHDAILWRLSAFSDSFYTYNKSLIRWRRHTYSSYTVESRSARSIKGKMQAFDVSQKYISTLEKYMKDENIPSEKKVRLLVTCQEWLDMRKEFYKKKNPLMGFKLFGYRKCYARFRQYIGDWYLVYLKK